MAADGGGATPAAPTTGGAGADSVSPASQPTPAPPVLANDQRSTDTFDNSSSYDASNDPQMVPDPRTYTPSSDPAPSNGPAADPTATSTGGASGPAGWSAHWEQVFQGLKLDPADIAFLRTSGYSDQQLQQIADDLSQQELLDPSNPNPTPSTTGNDPAGSGAGGVDPTGAAGGQPGWNAQWEQKFHDLLKSMGVSEADITKQLDEVRNTPLTTEQLQSVYDQMSAEAQQTQAAAGAWNDTWKGKFTSLMKDLKVPQDQIDQAIAQLSQGGFDDKKLQDIYDQMNAQRPGDWNDWKTKFETLKLPEDMMKSLSSSGIPESAYEKLYKQLLDIKMDNLHNGRLKKLTDAGASDDEVWGTLIEQDPNGGIKAKKMSDGDFDKTIDAIHSQHVPMWKRVANIALDFIPGVGALEYLTGSQWITGDKIDRTNPLNIGMAVLSAIPVVSYARGAFQAVRGAAELGTALNAAGKMAEGTSAVVTGTALAKTAGEGSKLAEVFGTMAKGASIADGATITGKTAEALGRMGTAWGELSTGGKLLRAIDTAKMVTPFVNRFGTAGELFSLGKGYFQATQFAATFANNVGKLSSLGSDGDKLIGKLPDLAKAEQTAASGGKALTATQTKQIAQILETTGMKPSEIQAIAQKVGPALEGQGVAFRAAGGMWRLNPFKNQSTVDVAEAAGQPSGLGRITSAVRGGGSTSGMETVNLGRGINNGIISGFKGMGQADFANIASHLSGTQLSEMATNLGVIGGGKFRALAQLRRVVLPGSEQAALADASRVAHSGSSAWGVASWAGSALNKNFLAPSISFLGFGLVAGQMRQPSQALWDYYKPGGEKQQMQDAQNQFQQQADADYQKQQEELDAAYAQYQQEQAGTGGAVDASSGAISAGSGPAADPTAAATGGAGGGQQLQDVA